MASHIHLFKPGASVTFAATEDVIGGTAVAISGDRSVKTAAVADPKFIGIAATDTKTGQDVLVLRGGVQNLTASGPITAGDRVAVAAGGKVTKTTEGGIGISLTTAADGTPAQIALD